MGKIPKRSNNYNVNNIAAPTIITLYLRNKSKTMGCLNCNTELNHTPGKRKKQFCSPDCRVRYWQKNKTKKVKISPAETDQLEQLLEWGPKIEAFCAKKGFPPSELIGKFEELEAFYEKFKGMSQVQAVMLLEDMTVGQNKSNTALKTEKSRKPSQKQKEGLKSPEISPGTGLPLEEMPKGLTPIQQAVWRNNQKMKCKTPPVTQFGVTKKEK